MSSKSLTPMQSKRFGELRAQMFTQASSVADRALVIAQRMNHNAAGEVHFLLGILALGNSDTLAPIPRVLRDAGGNYEALSEFLVTQSTLQADAGVPSSATIGFDASALSMLRRANRLATLRANRTKRHSIVTADLLLALLNSKNRLTKEALRVMGVNTDQIRERLADTWSGATNSATSRLTIVTN